MCLCLIWRAANFIILNDVFDSEMQSKIKRVFYRWQLTRLLNNVKAVCACVCVREREREREREKETKRKNNVRACMCEREREREKKYNY